MQSTVPLSRSSRRAAAQTIATDRALQVAQVVNPLTVASLCSQCCNPTKLTNVRFVAGVGTIADKRCQNPSCAWIDEVVMSLDTVGQSQVSIPSGIGSLSLEATRTYIAGRLIELDAVETGARLLEIFDPIARGKGPGTGYTPWHAHMENAWRMGEQGTLENMGLHPESREVLYRLDPKKAVR